MIKHTITGMTARERVIKRLNQFGMCFSQVFLSIALPFCLIPLQLATSNKDLMGPFYNKTKNT
jgi:Mn2+/Fe2+ NRAMP family transporter